MAPRNNPVHHKTQTQVNFRHEGAIEVKDGGAKMRVTDLVDGQ